MKINKTLLGMAVLTLIATAGITASYASRGYQADGLNVGPRFDQVNHQAIQDALDNNDYQTWSELMNGRGPADLITEDNFTKFVEMHKLMISGDKEGAQAIRDELDLPGFKMGMARGMQNENHQAIQDALDNNDYQTWSELMNGRGPADLITEDNFTKFVEMHKLMISGDKEGAQAIRDELGLSQMPNKANKGFGKGMGMGLHRGYRDR